MLQFVIGMLNNSSLLLFGVFVSAAILSIPFSKKNVAVLLAFCVFVNILQYVSYANFGLDRRRVVLSVFYSPDIDIVV